MAIEFVVYVPAIFIRREISSCQVAMVVGLDLRFKGITILLNFAFLKEEKPELRSEQT